MKKDITQDDFILLRIESGVKKKASEIAKENGSNISKEIRGFLMNYIMKHHPIIIWDKEKQEAVSNTNGH